MNGVRPSSFMSSVDIQIMAWTIGYGSLHDCMAVHLGTSLQPVAAQNEKCTNTWCMETWPDAVWL